MKSMVRSWSTLMRLTWEAPGLSPGFMMVSSISGSFTGSRPRPSQGLLLEAGHERTVDNAISGVVTRIFAIRREEPSPGKHGFLRMYLDGPPRVIETRVFATMPEKFRRKGVQTAWADANRG